jgi:hypothetical protein
MSNRAPRCFLQSTTFLSLLILFFMSASVRAAEATASAGASSGGASSPLAVVAEHVLPLAVEWQGVLREEHSLCSDKVRSDSVPGAAFVASLEQS